VKKNRGSMEEKKQVNPSEVGGYSKNNKLTAGTKTSGKKKQECCLGVGGGKEKKPRGKKKKVKNQRSVYNKRTRRGKRVVKIPKEKKERGSRT